MMDSKHPGTKMVYQFSLEDYIPKNHFLRLVDSVVDFSFVRDLVRRFYSDRGAPSVDPVVILKMSLLGYFYGISSERRLAEECRFNMAFKWFLHYDIDEIPPDHSIFSKARARYGREAFEQFFAEIVLKCRDTGLIDGERVFMDATLLKANASRKSLISREKYMDLRQSPREYIEALWRENPTEDGDPGDKGPGGTGGRQKTNEAVVSKTDPDAELVYRPGVGSMLAHKVHVTVADGGARIVTSVATSSGAIQEHTQVLELLTKHWMLIGEKPKEVVADAGYGITSTYEFLSRAGISANIPYRHARDVRREKKQVAGFRYDSDRDVRLPGRKDPEQDVYIPGPWSCALHDQPVCVSQLPSLWRAMQDQTAVYRQDREG